MQDAAPRIALVSAHRRVQVQEARRSPAKYFTAGVSWSRIHPESTAECCLLSALEEQVKRRSIRQKWTPLDGETWWAQVRRRKEGAPRFWLCYQMFKIQTHFDVCFHQMNPFALREIVSVVENICSAFNSVWRIYEYWRMLFIEMLFLVFWWSRKEELRMEVCI